MIATNAIAPRRAGRKRKAAVTLPEIASVAPRDRPRLAKARLAVQGAPLAFSATQAPGGLSVTKRQQEPWLVGEASDQRLAHARRSGKLIQQESETFDDGRPTGLKRKRFVPVIEQLAKRGTISQEAYHGLIRLQADHDRATLSAGRLICNYQGSVSGGKALLVGQEREVEHRKRVAAAIRAVGQGFRPVVAWVLASSNGDVSHHDLTKEMWPSLSKQTRGSRFFGLLEQVGIMLSEFYDGPRTTAKSKILSIGSAMMRIDDLLATA